jgi:hypothetical protein
MVPMSIGRNDAIGVKACSSLRQVRACADASITAEIPAGTAITFDLIDVGIAGVLPHPSYWLLLY